MAFSVEDHRSEWRDTELLKWADEWMNEYKITMAASHFNAHTR